MKLPLLHADRSDSVRPNDHGKETKLSFIQSKPKERETFKRPGSIDRIPE